MEMLNSYNLLSIDGSAGYTNVTMIGIKTEKEVKKIMDKYENPAVKRRKEIEKIIAEKTAEWKEKEHTNEQAAIAEEQHRRDGDTAFNAAMNEYHLMRKDIWETVAESEVLRLNDVIKRHRSQIRMFDVEQRQSKKYPPGTGVPVQVYNRIVGLLQNARRQLIYFKSDYANMKETDWSQIEKLAVDLELQFEDGSPFNELPKQPLRSDYGISD